MTPFAPASDPGGSPMAGLFLVHFHACRTASRTAPAPVTDVAEAWMPPDVRAAYGSVEREPVVRSRMSFARSSRPARIATDTASARPVTPSFR